MIQTKTLVKTLPHILETIDVAGWGNKYQGKVRDFYKVGDQRILITTDRLSAFDVVLGLVPYKGAVLNQLSKFWFEKTEKIVPNHLISTLDPNVTIAKNCQPIPVEMIVRGYISGVTKTSIWHSYQKGERKIYGLKFPDGLKKNQKLPQAVITPTTHPEAGSSVHDERLTKKEIISKKLVSRKLYQQMEDISLKLFDYGSRWCARKGLILVDTKYEFGLYKGQLILIDEVHTPDSSRFWIKKSYQSRFKQGLEPENFDKEFVRLWYAERGYRGSGTPPKMTKNLAVAVARRYLKVYEMITGKKFTTFSYPIQSRIKENLKKLGVIK